jgi:urease accessory protein
MAMSITTMNTDTSLLALMRLVSPALPVGGFAYSQGQEQAIDSGMISTAEDVKAWAAGVIRHGLAQLDVPLLCRLYRTAPMPGENSCEFERWNYRVLASRESAELRKEELQMGRALWRLLGTMNEPLPQLEPPTWLAAFALAAQRWGVSESQCCQGFLWAWLENQLAVAAKTVPIGQTDVQRISGELMSSILEAVALGMVLDDDSISGSLPGVVMASMAHETQYSRLFRS